MASKKKAPKAEFSTKGKRLAYIVGFVAFVISFIRFFFYYFPDYSFFVCAGSAAIVSFFICVFFYSLAGTLFSSIFPDPPKDLQRAKPVDTFSCCDSTPPVSASALPPLQTGPVLELMPEEKIVDITVPEIFDGCPLAYHYSKVPSANLDYDLAMRIAGSNQWEVQAEIRDGRPVILYDGQKLAVLADQARENMLSDWIRNGEPYKIYLETIHTDEKTAVFFLAFYRSLDRQMRGREKTVVKLTNCYSNEKQEWIALLSEGDELELSDDYTDDFTDCVNVLDGGTEIGRLPKRAAEKFLENGCAGCFLDHVDLDVEKDKYIPYVVIYW